MDMDKNGNVKWKLMEINLKNGNSVYGCYGLK